MDSASVPRLLPGVRLRIDGDVPMLLVPEGVVKLSASAVAIVSAIDGTRSVADIAAIMAERFETHGTDADEDVAGLLGRFAEHAWIKFQS